MSEIRRRLAPPAGPEQHRVSSRYTAAAILPHSREVKQTALYIHTFSHSLLTFIIYTILKSFKVRRGSLFHGLSSIVRLEVCLMLDDGTLAWLWLT